jgi:hypothetical protein
MLDLTVLPQPWISWTTGAGEFILIHHRALIWHRQTYIASKRWKASQRPALPLNWKCSKWSQEMVTCPSTKDLTNWYIAMITV